MGPLGPCQQPGPPRSQSVKSVSDLTTPVTGTVRTRNDDLARTPELVNTDPYGQGWMFETDIGPSTWDEQGAS
ncbi:hypothetical protein [Streptomyces sp. NPDC058086]|uniref:hypothetical protein n=1 Tax=Streptomyces sp. NPDC058086 TaxID=3346334 RepID=UPI0036EB3F7A